MLDAVGRYVKATHKSVALSIEPDWDADSVAVASLPAAGWARSATTILIPRTLILDLTPQRGRAAGAPCPRRRASTSANPAARPWNTAPSPRPSLPQVLAVYRKRPSAPDLASTRTATTPTSWRILGKASPIYGAFDGEKLVAFLWLAAQRLHGL